MMVAHCHRWRVMALQLSMVIATLLRCSMPMTQARLECSCQNTLMVGLLERIGTDMLLAKPVGRATYAIPTAYLSNAQDIPQHQQEHVSVLPALKAGLHRAAETTQVLTGSPACHLDPWASLLQLVGAVINLLSLEAEVMAEDNPSRVVTLVTDLILGSSDHPVHTV